MVGVFLAAYGIGRIWYGEVRLTRRTKLKGTAAKVVGVLYIIISIAIVWVVYLTYQLCLSAVNPFNR